MILSRILIIRRQDLNKLVKGYSKMVSKGVCKGSKMYKNNQITDRQLNLRINCIHSITVYNNAGSIQNSEVHG